LAGFHTRVLPTKGGKQIHLCALIEVTCLFRLSIFFYQAAGAGGECPCFRVFGSIGLYKFLRYNPHHGLKKTTHNDVRINIFIRLMCIVLFSWTTMTMRTTHAFDLVNVITFGLREGGCVTSTRVTSLFKDYHNQHDQ